GGFGGHERSIAAQMAAGDAKSLHATDTGETPVPRLGSDHSSQIIKKSRVSFVYAFRVADCHVLDFRAGEGEAHGHAVIVVGGDGGVAHVLGGGDDQRIVFHLDPGVEFFQFGGEGGDAVGFFFSQRVQATEGGIAFGKERDDGQSLG